MPPRLTALPPRQTPWRGRHDSVPLPLGLHPLPHAPVPQQPDLHPPLHDIEPARLGAHAPRHDSVPQRHDPERRPATRERQPHAA
ncbi:MAG TPA: hypothetical protein VH394_20295 [Thermoanaerobaculia bacterium]|nr:hypothetical protein [Thermoanaerobaculia bacterium]